MAINLSQLSAPKGQRPIIATIVGEGGIGKTSLAASFPSPVFIRTEDGTKSIAGRDDVALFPLATSSQDVLDAIASLATEPHDFETLVIDSITQLNTLIESEIVASDGKAKSINQALGGYGAGHSAVSDRHRQIREWAGNLSTHVGMNVVFIAHADSETVETPDNPPFTRYTLRMNRRSVAHYSDNVDLVAFLKLRMFTSGDGERKRAASNGERIITCYPTPSHISKNRFGITTDLTFAAGENPFAQLAYRRPAPQHEPVAQAA